MSQFTRILSLDGGGLRAIMSAEVLKYVEQKLQDFTGNSDARIADYFDLIAGTSAGGILTALYLCPDAENPLRPRCSAQEVYDFFRYQSSQIFYPFFNDSLQTVGGLFNEKYSYQKFNQVMGDFFKDLKLSELLKPCLITSYEIERREAHFFTQHDAKLNPKDDYLIRDVLRATSAAPTFFEVAQIHALNQEVYTCIDGGVFANNPALCAYAEARHKFNQDSNLDNRYETGPTAKEMVILSLGTGEVKKKYPYAEAKDWGKLKWLDPLFDIIMTGVAETVDYQMKQIFDTTGKPERYLRINTVLTDRKTLPMDDPSEANLKAISQLGQQLTEQYRQPLDQWIQLLLV
ncbi:Patatin-like protein 2 [Planktothrix tepida]|uniref:Patatin n=2 Tax=Planktothrix TaxID=54304 RepID=A0A1J1LSA0_9CYAN|nr:MULTISPECIES: patatin-like phospholipase family protein [Planktothrix]CAD5947146.1 Patatin-like protein 2 [Planktothrix pseudagardhii]CAD5963513.1 Patatin-like protein 2 [Planktothrix tepida]CUR34890.1 Patatin [Planktothrix tepida PCC 9214]